MECRFANAARHRSMGPLLAVIGGAAGWLALALLYALLGQPADTFAILHAQGPKGVPAVVWVGSRELVGLGRDVRPDAPATERTGE